MKESFAVTADNLKIHVLESEAFDSNLIPLVIVPGMMGIAEHYLRQLQDFSPRRVITFSHRGLGKSEIIRPGLGSFQQRCSDIDSVCSHLGLTRYILYGFSRGVPMIVAQTMAHPERVRGLVLHDCEPVYFKPPEKWRDAVIAAKQSHIPQETVIAYWQDAEMVNLMDQLPKIFCPTLLLRGEKEGSLLPLQRAQTMMGLIKSGKMNSLPHSAHELADEDRNLFIKTMQDFCRSCEV